MRLVEAYKTCTFEFVLAFQHAHTQFTESQHDWVVRDLTASTCCPPAQAVCGPIHGSEHLQKWGTHSSGLLVPGPQCSHDNEFPLNFSSKSPLFLV